MLCQQHHCQVEEHAGQVLWVADDGIQTAVDQLRGLDIALAFGHTAAIAEDEDGGNAENHREDPDAPAHPLQGGQPLQFVNEKCQDSIAPQTGCWQQG